MRKTHYNGYVLTRKNTMMDWISPIDSSSMRGLYNDQFHKYPHLMHMASFSLATPIQGYMHGSFWVIHSRCFCHIKYKFCIYRKDNVWEMIQGNRSTAKHCSKGIAKYKLTLPTSTMPNRHFILHGAIAGNLCYTGIARSGLKGLWTV